MSEQAKANPVKRFFNFGEFRLGYISPLRWELVGHGLGVERKTPWGAVWGWRKWRKEWRNMPVEQRCMGGEL